MIKVTEHFTNVYVNVFKEAQDIARTRHHQFLMPVHMLKSMFAKKIDDDTVVYDTLVKMSVDLTAFNKELDNELNDIAAVEGSQDTKTKIRYAQWSKQAREVVSQSKTEGNQLGDTYLAPDELMLSILRLPDEPAVKFLKKKYNVTYDNFKETLLKERAGSKVIAQNQVRGSSILDRYGTDLVAEAQKGNKDPIIGRDRETREVIQILLRKNKNNAILLGPAGVGKTAIVEGLAQKIAKNDVPDVLRGVRLYSLDLTALMAGASARGQFEGRFEAVLKQVERSNGKILLFIDEIHNIVGAGSSKGHNDASNILKPALARGKLHMIAATTLTEFKQYIESDAALTRRFARVEVEEPTEQQTINILRGLRPRFEAFHGVTFHDDALVDAVKMAERYIPERHLPDKAIELVDSAGSTVKLNVSTTPPALESDEKEMFTLQTEINSLMGDISVNNNTYIAELQDRQNQLQKRIDVERDNWKQAQQVLKELKELHNQLHTALNKYHATDDKSDQHDLLYKQVSNIKDKILDVHKNLKGIQDTVTPAVIDRIVSDMTGINANKLQEGEKAKLLRLPDELHKHVIGQDIAVRDVADAIKRSRAGLNSPNRPIGSFFFMGPTGVGKTQLSKTLATTLFDTEDSLIRIDMSEYQSKASITRLIGAPPGYVGYESAGQLTEKVRQHPYSVVLFDEVEKAHPDVLNLLLQVMDDGRLTDGKGRTINFKNTIIILTSNLGSATILNTWEDLSKPMNHTTESLAMKALYSAFRPEFINRIDHVLIFKPLSLNDIAKISQLYIKEMADRLKQNDSIQLKISKRALAFITVDSYDKPNGARPLRKYIQNRVGTILADAILEGKIKAGDTATIIREKGKNGLGDTIHRLALGTLADEKRLDGDPIQVKKNPRLYGEDY